MNDKEFLENLGIEEYKLIEGDAALKVAQTWLAAFCPHRTSFKGVRGGKTYLWDEIHSEYQNNDALVMYRKHSAPSYIVMADNFTEQKMLFVSRTKPNENKCRQDFHVYPKNMSWSIAFTHEDGWIGPKFFKHKNYLNLQRQNEKAMGSINREYV